MRVIVDFMVHPLYSGGDEYRLIVRDSENKILVWKKILKLHKILGKKVLKYLIDFYSSYSYASVISNEQFKNGGYTILWEREVDIRD